MTFAYSDGKWFACDSSAGMRVSSDGSSWSSPAGSSTGNYIENVVTLGSSQFIGRFSSYGLMYSGGSFSATNFSTAGCQFAASSSVVVAYSYNGKVYSSTNGATWVERALPTTITNQRIGRLIYSGGTFVLVLFYGLTSTGLTTSAPGTVYFTSSNGVDWTQGTRTYPSHQDNLNWGYWKDGYFANHSSGAFNYFQIGSSTTVASITVSAYLASGTLTYQWQLSTDAGTTWANVSGATSNVLSLSGLTVAADNGKRYRCIVSATGVASVTSSSATLTVT
jgi:hypothetical protein